MRKSLFRVDSLPFTANSTYINADTGDDSAGRRGYASRPFATFSGAIAASSAGDTIFVQPGTITETVALNPTRQYFCMEGVTLADCNFTTTSAGLHWHGFANVTRTLDNNTFMVEDDGAGIIEIADITDTYTGAGNTSVFRKENASATTETELIVKFRNATTAKRPIIAGSAGQTTGNAQTIKAFFDNAENTYATQATGFTGTIFACNRYTNSEITCIKATANNNRVVSYGALSNADTYTVDHVINSGRFLSSNTSQGAIAYQAITAVGSNRNIYVLPNVTLGNGSTPGLFEDSGGATGTTTLYGFRQVLCKGAATPTNLTLSTNTTLLDFDSIT